MFILGTTKNFLNYSMTTVFSGFQLTGLRIPTPDHPWKVVGTLTTIAPELFLGPYDESLGGIKIGLMGIIGNT